MRFRGDGINKFARTPTIRGGTWPSTSGAKFHGVCVCFASGIQRRKPADSKTLLDDPRGTENGQYPNEPKGLAAPNTSNIFFGLPRRRGAAK